jgi:hypothetical protein
MMQRLNLRNLAACMDLTGLDGWNWMVMNALFN